MVQTTRGVFYSLVDSNIFVISPIGSQLKFTSNKKRDIFLKKLNDRLIQIRQHEEKIYMITGIRTDITINYISTIYQKVYDEMLYK